MKKIFAIVICTLITVGCFAACTMNKPDDKEVAGSAERMKIVTTIFPEYDWVKQILGEKSENAEITLLLNNGVDLHSYQPTADDLVKIVKCDLFIYVGGESDDWVEDALSNRQNPSMLTINLLDELGDVIKAEEVKEGMQAEDEEDESGEEEETEYDEHVWLSLKNACTLCGVISEKICEIDPGNAGIYRTNTAAYTEKLKSLDAMYENAVNSAKVKTLVFGDRFPFRYLTDDYGLDYYAAFVGCSAESEADFETIVFLAKKLDEFKLNSIMQTESSDGSIAQAIKDTSQSKNQQILTLDSMQSTTSADINKGVTYLSVMEKNLEVLKEAMK
ncbi:MAG: metal ABC transporter substrate-binding protein [Clostridiales bacterium]|nr:metal ABC transporter substrate-binding protein [Clostridiales bacterium]